MGFGSVTSHRVKVVMNGFYLFSVNLTFSGSERFSENTQNTPGMVFNLILGMLGVVMMYSLGHPRVILDEESQYVISDDR